MSYISFYTNKSNIVLVFVPSVLNVRPVFIVSLHQRCGHRREQEYTTDTTQHSNRLTLWGHGYDVTVTDGCYGDKRPPEGIWDVIKMAVRRDALDYVHPNGERKRERDIQYQNVE